MSIKLLFLVLITVQGNLAIEFKSSQLDHVSFSGLCSTPSNDSLVRECLDSFGDSESRFVRCFCQRRICFNFYCKFFEIFAGDCENSDVKFEDFGLKENIVLIYDKEVKRSFKSMRKEVDLNSWTESNQDKDGLIDVVALKRKANGNVGFYLVEYCTEKEIDELSKEIRDWTNEHHWLSISVNSLSLICLMTLLLLFIFIKPSRTPYFKCWMGYSVAGIIDYSLALYFAFDYHYLVEDHSLYQFQDEDPNLLLNFLFCLYICVEFAQYIWISIIFFHVTFTLM